MMYAYSVSTKRSLVVAVIALALVLAAPAAWAAGGTVIETVSAWNGADGVEPFGEPSNATFGQTFIAPADNIMTSFTYFIDDFVNPDHVDFEAYVMAWDPDLFRATGPILWSDGPFTTTNNNGNGSYEQFTFDTRNLVLTAGAQYVAFLTASNLFDGLTGTSNWGAVIGDPYEDGVPVALDNGDDFSQVTSVTWLGPFPLDMAFEMTFDPSPRECPWDLDASGSVGASDLLALLVSWGPCKGCPADFDGNGNVGASDLLALLANWGPCP